jgi:hypothetical protein
VFKFPTKAKGGSEPLLELIPIFYLDSYLRFVKLMLLKGNFPFWQEKVELQGVIIPEDNF